MSAQGSAIFHSPAKETERKKQNTSKRIGRDRKQKRKLTAKKGRGWCQEKHDNGKLCAYGSCAVTMVRKLVILKLAEQKSEGKSHSDKATTEGFRRVVISQFSR